MKKHLVPLLLLVIAALSAASCTVKTDSGSMTVKPPEVNVHSNN